ncbi:MAG: aliphatic sulfonate ABC transporter substrate-binding protein [Caldilineaceae bacterium]|nr:aliphatic sulfonate ABC transporter substrate-binding protein [Caldilineaceae bacterium]
MVHRFSVKSTYLALLLALLLFSLAACGAGATPTTAPAPTAAPTEAPTEPLTATPAITTTAVVTTTEGVTATEAVTAARAPITSAATAVAYPTITITNKPDVVRIGYQAIPNAELIAKQLQWHEQALGTAIEWRQFESGRDVNTAIASGSIDIGLVGSSPAAAGLAQGLPYEVVAFYDLIGDSEALAVRGSIQSFADLKGKKLGAPFGSTTHYSLLQVLQLNGISPDEVTLLDFNPADLLAAWTRGDLDGAYVWQPTLQKLYDDGGTKLIGSDEVAAQGFPTFDVAIVTRDFASQYPEAVALYVQNLSKAVDLYRSDPTQAAALLAAELSITPEEATAQAAGLIWLTASEQLDATYFGTSAAPGALGQALKTTADFLVAQKVLESAPELSVFQSGANPAFLQQAVGQ